jgi:RNA polymerase sigma factor (TIGR02999 family)
MASGDVTQLLQSWGGGNREALDELLPVVYAELRNLARRALSTEKPGHTLQSTALVHEAYLRLVEQNKADWQNRAQFFSVAARIVRRVLVDHARSRLAVKRGGGLPRLSIEDALGISERPEWEILALDDALKQLAEMDPQQAQVVELRFFSGLTVEETAEALRLSVASVKRDWATAKAWLARQVAKGGSR